MRLKLLGGGAIALVFALVVVACGGGSASSDTGNDYKPEVKLVCVAKPCGSNPAKAEAHGTYYAEETNFPAYTSVIVTVTYPDGQPYLVQQYSNVKGMYGVVGTLLKTDGYGQLPEFGWEAANSNGLVDPPGVYKVAFHLKYHGEIVVAHTHLVMERLPNREAAGA